MLQRKRNKKTSSSKHDEQKNQSKSHKKFIISSSSYFPPPLNNIYGSFFILKFFCSIKTHKSYSIRREETLSAYHRIIVVVIVSCVVKQFNSISLPFVFHKRNKRAKGNFFPPQWKIYDDENWILRKLSCYAIAKKIARIRGNKLVGMKEKSFVWHIKVEGC